jgi:hypothetical protein
MDSADPLHLVQNLAIDRMATRGDQDDGRAENRATRERD